MTEKKFKLIEFKTKHFNQGLYREEDVKEFVEKLKEDVKKDKRISKIHLVTPFIWDIIDKLTGFEEEKQNE